jgi:hypothetical protein
MGGFCCLWLQSPVHSKETTNEHLNALRYPNSTAEEWHNRSKITPAKIDEKAAKPVKENALDHSAKPRIE